MKEVRIWRISRNIEDEIWIHQIESNGLPCKIASPDPDFEGDVVAIVSEDTRAGMICALVERLDSIAQTEFEARGSHGFNLSLCELLTIVAKTKPIPVEGMKEVISR
jgi:hypothetical protein